MHKIEPSPWRNASGFFQEEPEVTNSEFAKKDPNFRRACKKAAEAGYEVHPDSSRQASKWRNNKGIARKFNVG